MTAYMAWKGIQGDENIWWSYYDSGAWATPDTVKQTGGTSGGLALTELDGTLLLAWKGSSDQSIYWNKRGTSDWAGHTAVPNVGTSNGPALHGNGMVWKGAIGPNSDDQSIWTSLFDGIRTWTPQQPVPGTGGTSGVPALAKRGNTTYMAWKGPDGDPAIYWTTYDGTSWNPNRQEVPGTGGTSAGPALAATSTGLLMAWKGPAGTADEQSIFYTTFDGTQWNPYRQQAPGMGTSTGPALVALASGTLMTWKGAIGPSGNDQTIWWSTFDGRNWKPQDTVPNAGTSDRPALATTGGY